MKAHIDGIINSGHMGSLYITGGGTGAIAALLVNGGGSKFLVEARVPYAEDVIQNRPFTTMVSSSAANHLARLAYDSAVRHGNTMDYRVGVSSTSKLTYEGEREDRIHQIWIGTADKTSIFTYSYKLKEGLSRLQQEEVNTKLIIGHLAYACGACRFSDIRQYISNPEDYLSY